MKADWTPAGGSLVNFGDDSTKYAVWLEAMGGESVDQIEQLAGAAYQGQYNRGNVIGDCVFTSAKSYASIDLGAAAFAVAYASLDQKGKLELTFVAHKLTLDNAVLKGVRRIFDDESKGLRWKVRYTFGVTTIAYS